MSNQQSDKTSPDVVVAKFILQYWAWLGWLMLGQQKVSGYVVDGFSARWRAGGCMVVVRALRIDDMHRVVAFGQGESLYIALRNVTSSIVKAAWKADKFAKDW